MNKLIISLVITITSSGCGFKKHTVSENDVSGLKIPLGQYKRSDSGVDLVLVDTIDFPKNDYEIDLTRKVDGEVFFPIQKPVFKDTECDGLGYSVTYADDKHSATSTLKLVPFVNGEERGSDHVTVSGSDSLSIGVYAEYQPIADYIDSKTLPTEFNKSLQPSNRCHNMCHSVRAKPVRPMVSDQKWGNCFYTDPVAPDRRVPTTDLWFFDFFDSTPECREYSINRLMACDAVRNNDDLREYWKQLTAGPCYQNEPKYMQREWYFVEIKIPIFQPQYSVHNLKEIIKATTITQSDFLENKSVHPRSDWRF